jgi:hypothetical protein
MKSKSLVATQHYVLSNGWERPGKSQRFECLNGSKLRKQNKNALAMLVTPPELEPDPLGNHRKMKTADQAPNRKNQRRHHNKYGGKSQNISKAAVQALISELEQTRLNKLIEKTSDRPPVDVTISIGIDSHYLNETQQLDALATALRVYASEFSKIGMHIRNPNRRICLAYAIKVSQTLKGLNLKTFSSRDRMNDPMPPMSDVPASFNVWFRSLWGVGDFISGVLYENFAVIARIINKLPPFVAAELAGALHIAHTIHLAINPKARDLKSEDFLKEHLERWANNTIVSERYPEAPPRQEPGSDVAAPLQPNGNRVPIVPWAKA